MVDHSWGHGTHSLLNTAFSAVVEAGYSVCAVVMGVGTLRRMIGCIRDLDPEGSGIHESMKCGSTMFQNGDPWS